MFKGILQHSAEDCGAACLTTILKYHGKTIPINDIKRKLSYGKEGANILGIVEVGKQFGLDTDSLRGSFQELCESLQKKELQLPMIVHIKLKNNAGHFFVLKKITNKNVKVFDPAKGNRTLSTQEFNNLWTGYIINFQKGKNWKNVKIPSKKYLLFLKALFFKKRYIINLFFFSLLIIAISYASTSFTKNIVDIYILNGQSVKSPIRFLNLEIFNLKWVTILIIFLFVIQLILNISKGITTAKLSKDLNTNFSDLFYKKILDIRSVFFNRMESGEITSRFQSIINLQQLLINSLLTLTLESISSIIGGIVLFILSPVLFFLVIIVIIIYSIVVTVFIPKLKEFNKQFYSKYSESLTFFNQTLRGINTIKINNSKQWFQKKFSIYIDKFSYYQYKSQTYGTLLSSLVSFIDAVGAIIILIVGANLVTQRKISLGTLIAFQALMYLFLDPLKSLILLQDELQNLSVIIERLNDIFKEPPESIDQEIYLPFPEPENFDIDLIDIEYADGFNVPIIHNINLQIKSGEHIGITGVSGSGKSTLLKILATINVPTKGTYLIDGVPVHNYSLETIRSNISYVEQDTHIFPATVIENLLMGDVPIFNNEYFNLICETCGIYDINSSGKSILNFELMEDGNNLSGGQKQKIGIARALLKKPKLLLLDEATSNIDKGSEKKIYDLLKTLTNQMTVVDVSHNKRVNEYAKDLKIIKNGTI